MANPAIWTEIKHGDGDRAIAGTMLRLAQAILRVDTTCTFANTLLRDLIRGGDATALLLCNTPLASGKYVIRYATDRVSSLRHFEVEEVDFTALGRLIERVS